MLFRHIQPLFLSTEWTARPVTGPRMSVRPVDGDTPDHAARFLLWAAVQGRGMRAAVDPAKAPSTDPVKDPPKAPGPMPSPTKMLIEMSPDGEGWTVVSTLDPRDRPYLVTVPHMLRYVRVKLYSAGSEARGYALVMANTPFELIGGDPRIGPRPDDVIVVTGTRT